MCDINLDRLPALINPHENWVALINHHIQLTFTHILISATPRSTNVHVLVLGPHKCYTTDTIRHFKTVTFSNRLEILIKSHDNRSIGIGSSITVATHSNIKH
jgi:nicotinic acid mononucleotide adenylyltransferase